MDFPGYRIIEPIGNTAYSSVFRAYREEDGETVVIKALRHLYPSPVEKARLRHEYEVIRHLRLDGVVAVLDILDTYEGIALVLEDFGGVSLKTQIGPTGLPLDEFLSLAVTLSDILGKIHLENIIHRDIKPQNILVHPQSRKVKFTDFGIAAEVKELFLPGVIEGTLAYLSPEQTGRINRPVDYRSDLYSLGITFYEMLTGRVPFLSTDPMEVIHFHIARSPTPPERVNPQIPTILSRIVLKMTAKIPEERYQNAFGLKADLERCRDDWQRNRTMVPFELGQKDQSLRFSLPLEIFGRERETAFLVQAFERAARGGVEVLFLSGEGGIGKSALVGEIQRPVIEKKGYFIAGKCDPLGKGVPYSGIIQALSDWLHQVAGESEERIKAWREKLLWAVEGNGRILLDLIPEMEWLIGPQGEVPVLGPEEARNRFHRVFRNLFQVLAQGEHPLVLFLDDLHWLDTSSLELLKVLLDDPELRYLLFVGTYREGEETYLQLLKPFLESLKQKRVPLSLITLGPLDEDAITHLLASTLRRPPADLLPLTKIIRTKTQGNPFFLREFLKTLYGEGHIFFDPLKGWTFDPEKIQNVTMTDNVVQFMVRRLQDLPPEAEELLRIGACLGTDFPFSLAARLHGRPLEEVFRHLSFLEEEGLITYKNGRCFFAHDRIREAAYSLLTSEEKEALHYRAGRTALEELEQGGAEESLFFVTDQLNRGGKALAGPEEKRKLAELNLRSARKAKEAAAYGAAIQYLERGLELLEEDAWRTDYDLTYGLHLELLECRYLHRDFQGCQALFQTILKETTHPIDRGRAYKIMVILLTNMARPQEAVDLAIKGLAELGVPFPRRIGRKKVLKELKEVLAALKEIPEDRFLALPPMTDPLLSTISDLYVHMGTPLFYVDPLLFALLIIRGLKATFDAGHPQYAPLTLISLATLVQSYLDDYALAFDLGELALKLNDRLDTRKLAGRILHTFAFFIQHWKRHLRFDVETYFRGYERSVQNGDYIFAGLALSAAFQLKIRLDQPLDQVLAEMRSYRHFVGRVNDPLSATQFNFLYGYLRHLRGDPAEGRLMTGEEPEFTLAIDWFRKENNLFALSLTLFSKTGLLMNAGKWEEAYQTALELDGVIHVLMGCIVVAQHYFQFSWILLHLLIQGEKDRKNKFLALIRRNQQKLRRWAELCPENFRHWFDFIEALRHVLKKDFWKALDGFHQAIEGARKNGFLEDEALFCERTALFYEEAGFGVEARALMDQARDIYLKWGARSRAKQLEERYPTLVTPLVQEPLIADDRATETRTATFSSQLDLSALLEASQTIFSEIVLDRLLEKIMGIALINAGAQRGFLILLEDGRLTIEASQEFETEETKVRQSLPLEDHGGLSLPVVHYVFRTGKTLILGDASAEGPFVHDPYIRKHRVRSVLCTPIIYQGRISGVLYLENNLTAQAFTPERVELLGLIAAQAAISLENARLFEQATTDGLTRLYVRRYFHLLLDQEFERALRHGSAFSLLMIDIDNFKTINDTFGHPFGDEVLRRVAEVLRKNSRSVDIAARYGGEEFVLLLPETDAPGARVAAEKIRHAVEWMDIPAKTGFIRVTVSIGVGVFPTLARDKADLILCADQALYAAKKAGKNRVILGEEIKERGEEEKTGPLQDFEGEEWGKEGNER